MMTVFISNRTRRPFTNLVSNRLKKCVKSKNKRLRSAIAAPAAHSPYLSRTNRITVTAGRNTRRRQRAREGCLCTLLKSSRLSLQLRDAVAKNRESTNRAGICRKKKHRKCNCLILKNAHCFTAGNLFFNRYRNTRYIGHPEILIIREIKEFYCFIVII